MRKITREALSRYITWIKAPDYCGDVREVNYLLRHNDINKYEYDWIMREGEKYKINLQLSDWIEREKIQKLNEARINKERKATEKTENVNESKKAERIRISKRYL